MTMANVNTANESFFGVLFNPDEQPNRQTATPDQLVHGIAIRVDLLCEQKNHCREVIVHQHREIGKINCQLRFVQTLVDTVIATDGAVTVEYIDGMGI